MQHRINVKCGWCGKDFSTKVSVIKKGGGKYCSTKCYSAWQSENLQGEKSYNWLGRKVEQSCKFCGGPFFTTTFEIDQNRGKFCSRKCAGAWRSIYFVGENAPTWSGGGITCICKTCGKEFISQRSRILAGWGKFCSRRCQGIQWSKESSGSANLRWLGGKSSEPYTSDFNKVTKSFIRQRDGNECLLCGRNKSERIIHVHHIDYDKKNTTPVRHKCTTNQCSNC